MIVYRNNCDFENQNSITQYRSFFTPSTCKIQRLSYSNTIVTTNFEGSLMKKLFLLLLSTAAPTLAMENVGKELLASAGIIGTSVAATTLYGIANAELSNRLCPEFFTAGGMFEMQQHMPKNFLVRRALENTKSTTKKAAIWGAHTSWWMGLGLGIPLALAARLGSAPSFDAQDLAKPIALAMLATGAGSLACGAYGRYLANKKDWLEGFKSNSHNAQLMKDIPAQSHKGYVIAAFNTIAGYRLGALAGLGLVGYVIKARMSVGR